MVAHHFASLFGFQGLHEIVGGGCERNPAGNNLLKMTLQQAKSTLDIEIPRIFGRAYRKEQDAEAKGHLPSDPHW